MRAGPGISLLSLLWSVAFLLMITSSGTFAGWERPAMAACVVLVVSMRWAHGRWGGVAVGHDGVTWGALWSRRSAAWRNVEEAVFHPQEESLALALKASHESVAVDLGGIPGARRDGLVRAMAAYVPVREAVRGVRLEDRQAARRPLPVPWSTVGLQGPAILLMSAVALILAGLGVMVLMYGRVETPWALFLFAPLVVTPVRLLLRPLALSAGGLVLRPFPWMFPVHVPWHEINEVRGSAANRPLRILMHDGREHSTFVELQPVDYERLLATIQRGQVGEVFE